MHVQLHSWSRIAIVVLGVDAKNISEPTTIDSLQTHYFSLITRRRNLTLELYMPFGHAFLSSLRIACFSASFNTSIFLDSGSTTEKNDHSFEETVDTFKAYPDEFDTFKKRMDQIMEGLDKLKGFMNTSLTT